MKIPCSYFLYCLALLLCANPSDALVPESTASTEDDTPPEIDQTEKKAAPDLKIGWGLAALGLLGLAAGGSGGGGGGGSSNSSGSSENSNSSETNVTADVPTPPPVSLFPVFPSPPPVLSWEYTPLDSMAHQQINTIWPHSVGIKGAGVTVAVVDSGIFPSVAFGPRLLPGIDMTTDKSGRPNNNGLVDPDGHGTGVAGIIAAGLNGLPTVGVAPEATVVPIRVFNADGFGSTRLTYNGIRSSKSLNARIYNMSLEYSIDRIEGSTDYDSQATIMWLASNGKIGVVAAGNSGATNPSYPGQYAIRSYAQGSIIVVGSVDSNNQLSSFSNAAGNVADYYLVAPGENIVTPSPQTDMYQRMSGTSAAAPMVSGGAALVWGNWPYLSPQSVVQILLQSATPIGPSEIYGHGLLNLKAAFEPIGTFTMLLPNSNSSVPYGSSAVRTPAGTRITSSSLHKSSFLIRLIAAFMFRPMCWWGNLWRLPFPRNSCNRLLAVLANNASNSIMLR